MPLVRELILSDGTRKLTSIRVPQEEAAKLDPERLWLLEAWRDERVQRAADALRASAEAANRPVQPDISPPDEPSAA